SGLKGPSGQPSASQMGGALNPTTTFVAVVRPLTVSTDADMTLGAYGEGSGNYPRIWLATWGGFWHLEVTRGHENYCNNICVPPPPCDPDCASQLGPEAFLVSGGAMSTEWSIVIGSKGADAASVSLDGEAPGGESQMEGLPPIGSEDTQIFVGGVG